MHKVISLVIVLLLLQNVLGSEGGINENMSLEETGISSIEYQNIVIESEIYNISITLDDDTAENNTSMIWVTQICINSGVCYPPQNNDMITSDNGKLWESSLIIIDDASYLNWRIEMNWSDGEKTNVPENGFGWKVWSNCWFDGKEWGGPEDSCNSEDNNRSIPGFEVLIIISSVLITLLIKPKKWRSNRVRQ
ncbi:MAG: hypothetical protein HOJ64_01060 [Euryarchaeota archaeon]|jgi:hypothetical protein|nr:hypothetical protein [Euryarchaeota archaeon]MBT4391748.1 hypothetical protein [Euryarchaeota archaeon]MBT4802104.1 hypothetical protein [Euryarchaeota archaeon]MBT5613446.1 hypothetical protein [Euryarchaeota archaeon]MBT6683307.1 hypothetical protein [Euryarchaeota archaeon]